MKIKEGFPFKMVQFSSKIEVTKETLWNVISRPKNLELFHPFVKENPTERWNKKDSRDTIIYYNNLVLNRIFLDWVEGKSYTLIIGNSAYATAKVHWDIIENDSKNTSINITIYYYPSVALGKYPAMLQPLIDWIYLKPKLKEYVKSVVLGIKFYSESGIKVKKNQFGFNPMFSRL
ncbi:MAG: hypothetical protein CNE98_06130 [Bacteroidetes bacterium MED-G17]|nr:MAG: hypothetical protein CBB99_02310 [Bacteroidetes bacterium TMED39]PDH52100.1 MAG: hypothetical protein CNE98_06130 [Bacteroidetes bacterium MED-G17]CAI8276623.1 MAG: Uncharacterised protein [Bacteroidetes bacterium MED-G17]|tara:strand:- start:4614 stop:5141 length:528 start_codon:yes stop_codon:yes gene_type:complete